LDPSSLDRDRAASGAADLRGFTYALEPLHRQRAWRLEQLRQQLAQVKGQLTEQRQELVRLNQAHAAGSRAALDATKLRLDPGTHVRSLAYLAQLQHDMAKQTKKVEALLSQYDELQQDYFRAHKNLEALDQHRDLAVKDFQAEKLRQQAVEADRDWLSRLSARQSISSPGVLRGVRR
jgi:septal ring factor EnvC (AmiA/AmiB activator)